MQFVVLLAGEVETHIKGKEFAGTLACAATCLTDDGGRRRNAGCCWRFGPIAAVEIILGCLGARSTLQNRVDCVINGFDERWIAEEAVSVRGDAEATRMSAAMDAHCKKLHGEVGNMTPLLFLDHMSSKLQEDGSLSEDLSAGAIGHGNACVTEGSALAEIFASICETVRGSRVNTDGL